MTNYPQQKIPLEGAWAAVPVAMLRDSRLRAIDTRVYSILRFYAGRDVECWPKVPQVAADAGVVVRTVQRAYANLKKCGYIKVRRGIWGNVYRLYEPEIEQANAPESHVTPPSYHATGESPHATSESPHATSESDPSIRLDSPSEESPSSEGDEDGRPTQLGQENPHRIAVLLQSVGIVSWRKVQKELEQARIPYELIEARVESMRHKEPGIIVHALRELPFAPHVLPGMQPGHVDFRAAFERLGITMTEDDDIPDLDNLDALEAFEQELDARERGGLRA